MRRAAEAVDKLAQESQSLAAKAQALQDKGQALPAQHAMIEAHQRMKQVGKHMGFWSSIFRVGGFVILNCVARCRAGGPVGGLIL